jgi:hypothetical protein
MRDNLLFFNIPERDQENTTEIIHELLETKMEIRDAPVPPNWKKKRRKSQTTSDRGQVQLSSRPRTCADKCKEIYRNEYRGI